MCHSRAIRRGEKIFLSASKWLRFGSNRGVGRISENNANAKEMKRGRENDECTRKRLRYRKTFVQGKWISRDLSDACTVEISIDSQLGWIPSVVSAPIPHPRPLTLPSHSPWPPFPFSCLSPFPGSKSFLLLFTDISVETVSCIGAPYLAASYPWSLSSRFTFLYLCTALPFYLPASRQEKVEGIAPKLAQWIPRIHFV